ncbi:MAG: cysteine--tRNA ligase [Candidatus Kapaibacterium sp.]
MQIKLHNSLSRQTEELRPIEDNLVRIYSCGPTVYNYAHIGNMRAFLFADLLQRVIRTVGANDVRWVMNITNIDDKTIRDSSPGSQAWRSEMGEQTDDPHENLRRFTAFYENEFMKDISTLGIDSSHFFALPKATEYIDQMQGLIRRIVDHGYGYVSGGSVYFDVSAWSKSETYGRLKKIDFDNFRTGERIDADQYERDQVSDFVLWKARKENEPYWDFEIGDENCPGRPGWHIECSAMERELLGLPFDIHTGGIDLKFPHHEDEIAQSMAGYKIDPTNIWCHNEFLEVEGHKMSKSAGNFFTLRDLLDKGIDPVDIRYSMLSAHYGSTFNFTFDGIEAARKARFRVQEYIYKLFDESAGEKDADIAELRKSVFAELANDLHTPKALGRLFSFLNEHDPSALNSKSRSELIKFFEEMNSIFAAWEIGERPKEEIPEIIIKMADERLAAKKQKDFAKADELRDKIAGAGYLIRDTKDGYSLEKN